MHDENYIRLSRFKVIFLASCVGVIVASMFYIQPIEKLLVTSLATTPQVVSVIAMLVQVSYALGLLLVVPLGDSHNRYHFLQLVELLSVISLLTAALSPNVIVFGIASVAIGLTSVGGQIIIPYVAYLTPVKHQGPVLGAMISGMLTGILLARTFSGIIAQQWGWQMVYLIAAVINLIFLISIHFLVPDDPRQIIRPKKYSEVIKSLPGLVRKYRYLRGSAVNAFCLFALANLFWSTLSFLLADRFGYGSAAAGSMGLLGIVSIIATPMIGRMAGTYSPQSNIKLSWLLAAIAYLVFTLFTRSIIVMMLGIILLDLSTQFSQVTNQAIIQSLSREANSRNNSVFMFAYFFGGSIGTLVGINVWAMFNWQGVAIAAVFFLLLAAINYYWQGVLKVLGSGEKVISKQSADAE